MAWCNGTGTGDKSPELSTVRLVKELGGNANQYSVSIECEGLWSQTQGALTDAQLASVAWLIGHIRDEVKRLYGHDIPPDRQHMVGHNEITPRTRPHCPGEKFPWDVLMQHLNGSNPAKTLYRVQIGAFASRANAETLLAEVKSKGLDAFIVTTEG